MRGPAHGAHFSKREESLITDWASPPSWGPETAKEAPPPGRGKFLVKVGGRPGIPVELAITQTEVDLHDTNKRWASATEMNGLRR